MSEVQEPSKKRKLKILDEKGSFIVILIAFILSIGHAIGHDSSFLKDDGLYLSSIFKLIFYSILGSISSVTAIFVPTFIKINYVLFQNRYRSFKLKKDKKEIFEKIFGETGQALFTLLSHISALVFASFALIYEIVVMFLDNLEKLANPNTAKDSDIFNIFLTDLPIRFLFIAVVAFLVYLLGSLISGKLYNMELIGIYEKYEKSHNSEKNLSDYPPFASKVTLYRHYIVVVSIAITWADLYYFENTANSPDLTVKWSFLAIILLLIMVFYFLHSINLSKYRTQVKNTEGNENMDDTNEK